ncbi:MAG: 4-alpha-glucanotransferase, partial [Candidatus Omnitrophota bacterium]
MLEKNLYDHLLTTISKEKWQRIGLKRRAGILAPLFSIYSKRSLGVGDLEDLKLLIDWCNKTSLSIIQLLPMNELGPIFCPYDSISSFALEPVYIAIEKIPGVNEGFIKQKVEKLKKDFPVTKSYVDYHVKKEKLNILWEIFQEEDYQNSKELKNFQQENIYWINDFALFKALKDYHQGNAWYDWEEGYKNRNKLALENFYRENELAINFQIWLQMQLYKQFKNVKDYAIKRKVFIKGDLPILVSRDSADVWAHQEFFKLEFASGAPPDMYTALGQRWGMPTYNWQTIAQDDYKYVKEKLKYAENFYDILRI